jgi:gliding motility-associated-like protein
MTLSISDPGLQECPNKYYQVEIIATVNNGTMPYTYNWDASTDNDSIINFTVSNPGQLVSLNVIDDCQNQIPASINIAYQIYTPMVVNALPVDSVCVGETRELNATATDGIPPLSYSWNDGTNSYSGEPTMYSSLISGINNVVLTVTDKCGIQELSNVDVLVIPCNIVTPNVFTPNGDAFNQTLVFENLEFFPENNITIFNRWGNKIYEKENYQNDWDGNGAAVGTYYYIINLNNVDNKTHKGTFTILK